MIDAIDRGLREGGQFHFWTDVLDYYEATVQLIAQRTRWDVPHLEEEHEAEHDLDYRTHFERRTRLGGLPVYRCYYEKTPQ